MRPLLTIILLACSALAASFSAVAKESPGDGELPLNIATVPIPAPKLLSITSATADGSYKAGASIEVTLTFTEPVTLEGGPLLVKLNAADGGRTIELGKISKSAVASGRYVVQAGDLVRDLTVSGVTLAGGTLRSAEGVEAELALPAGSNLGDGSDIALDTEAPRMVGLSITSDNRYLRIVFSEPVFGGPDGRRALAAGDFALTLKGGSLDLARTPAGIAVDGYVVVLQFNLKGIADGTEILSVFPAFPDSVVDVAGNPVLYLKK
jgi:hypothetical protein